MKIFPIVDISYLLEKYGSEEKASETFLSDKNIKVLSEEIYLAFREWGFVYLNGHGISQDFIQHVFKISKDFFELPDIEKNKVQFIESEDAQGTFGYMPFKVETFDHTKPYDLKEAFDYLPWISDGIKKQLSIEFVDMFQEMYAKCGNLIFILLRLLNVALGIDDNSFLEKAHRYTGVDGNVTILRSLYYPAIPEGGTIEDEQSRCGEHTDYGTVTLLFQDDAGGLEVQSPTGEFIHALPIPGTIVVNAADLLERWTSGRVKSTRHRVVLPVDRSKPRQSIAFFCQPDNDVTVNCLDGSNMYEPVNSLDYITEQLQKSYPK